MNTTLPFQWQCQPQAEKLLIDIVERLAKANPFISRLQEELLHQTSTRLFDWIDHLVIPFQPGIEGKLEKAGFSLASTMAYYRVYYHPGAQLPRLVVQEKDSQEGLALAVDSISDFLMVRGLSAYIEGSPYSPYRRCLVSREGNTLLWVVERRGCWTMEPVIKEGDYLQRYLKAKERWKTRLRSSSSEEKAMQLALDLAEELVQLVGKNLAAWIVLEAEREYWQRRNTAGQIQKSRQDRLGMGWANHDHHTFRSSRRFFSHLVRLFEILGFHCRERFYAGVEAGWGAQVMENPECKLVLFLDVDLSPEEVEGDFAHQPLPDLPQLGTIGLWCALHGDSILKAGMHHLEAQFMFEELSQDLAREGIQMMKPFSSFPYLKQAFTVGEVWAVDPTRIETLRQKNKISEEHAQKFLTQGAIGSHLENLQRREGYKGFNQKNVSVIIKKTDPRN